MVRQFAEYQVERTAQFQYSFRSELLARRLDKFWATVEADRLVLRPGENQSLCYERAMLEYQIDEQADRELYPELPWSNREPMEIALLWEQVRRPESQGTRVTLRMDDELL